MMGPSVSPIRGKQVLAASVQLSGAITDRGEYYTNTMLQRKPPSLPPLRVLYTGQAGLNITISLCTMYST